MRRGTARRFRQWRRARQHLLALAVSLAVAAGMATVRAAAAPSAPADDPLCGLVESASAANHLPVDYLTRLLWTESGFDTGAVSPAGAQGIAQFMPETAAERGLVNPRDPAAAITHAAQLLVELDRHFGNLGLAAAAYNAGPARLSHWMDG
ncbi:MAG TPA: transglycosylase SLT domain-containing protein, partial [Stellaceae bacterium]|nr:transglycosylase SLT domain-containing protein [Stellaceae bacterium]